MWYWVDGRFKYAISTFSACTVPFKNIPSFKISMSKAFKIFHIHENLITYFDELMTDGTILNTLSLSLAKYYLVKIFLSIYIFYVKYIIIYIIVNIRYKNVFFWLGNFKF